MTVDTQEITILGDLAYDRGTLHVVLTPKKAGPSVIIERRFLEIWRKEDGKWKIIRAMDNQVVS